MLLSIIISFLIVGFISIFMSGVVANFTQEQYNLIIDEKPNSLIQKIWSKYDEIIYSLFVIDVIFVLPAMFIAGIANYTEDIILILARAFTIVLGVIFGQLLFFYLGKKLSNKLFLKWSRIIYIIAFPIIPLVKNFTSLIIKISGKEKDDMMMEEITDLFEEAREEGSLDAEEYRLLKNVMNFNDILVSDVMTPRIVLFSCDATITVDEAIKKPELHMYSRFPIWQGDSLDDEVLGYVTTKEIFREALNGNLDKKISEFSRPINFVPENAELGKTLESLLIKKQQLLLVVDEYGAVEGLITMEDIIETMLGVEIVDEADKVVDLRALAKSRREIRLKENYNFEEE